MWTEPRPGTLVVDGLTAAREKEARLEAVRERLLCRCRILKEQGEGE